MRRKIGAALMLSGLALILIALVLLGRNYSEEAHSRDSALEKAQEVSNQISLNISQGSPVKEFIPEGAVKELFSEDIEGVSFIGMLEIPVIELKVPVIDTLSYENLRIAPCREEGTTPYDMVIAGHNYKGHFINLKNVVPGDLLSFTDMDGVMTAYEVGIVEIIEPTDVDKVKKSCWDMVLYTCNNDGRKRIMAGCKALEK